VIGLLVEGGAEVADLDVGVAADQDVGGLDVAVDDAVALCEGERQAAFEHDLDHLAHRQQVGDVAVVLQRLPVHVLHHDVGQVLIADRVVDREDVRVEQLADQRRFVQEHLAEAAPQVGVPRRLVVHHLDRDLAVGERVASQVDHAGRAAPDLPQDGVFADLVGQGGVHGWRVLARPRGADGAPSQDRQAARGL
jgi:hypothetical protein